MAQSIIYSPWEETKGPWLCLMTELLLLGLLWLFSFVLTSLIKLILWLKFFHRKKAGWGHGGQGPKGPAQFHVHSLVLTAAFPAPSSVASTYQGLKKSLLDRNWIAWYRNNGANEEQCQTTQSLHPGGEKSHRSLEFLEWFWELCVSPGHNFPVGSWN